MTVLLAGTAAVLATLLVWSIRHNRRDFIASPGVFRCNVRLRSAQLPGISSTWARRPCHAMWVHDVLIIRRGLLGARQWYLPAHMAQGDPIGLNPRRVRGLGRHPMSMVVLLDDREEIELAAAGRDLSLLVGPFVAVAAASLPDDTASA